MNDKLISACVKRVSISSMDGAEPKQMRIRTGNKAFSGRVGQRIRERFRHSKQVASGFTIGKLRRTKEDRCVMQFTRLTGSYYTSQRIANYMVKWALRNSTDSLLEPSFGDGVFLDAAFNRFTALGNNAPTVIGVESQPTVFSKYADSAPASFVGCCKNFMDYTPESAVSAVVGNPPYVSLRNLKEEDRAKAIDRIAKYKIKMLSSGSLWMAFTIHASNMLAQNGRLAFVLPFEITYVKYAYPLWTYIGNNFGSVKVVRIHEDFFPDVDVETVLLLADQYGASTHHVDFEIYDHVDALFANEKSVKSKIELSDITHRKKPFTFSMLNKSQRSMVSTLRKEGTIIPLIDLCKFNIGYVCADKEYFHPSDETCKLYQLPPASLVPSISNGKEINDGTDVGAVVGVGKQINNLFLPEEITAADQRYIKHGVEAGVNLRYKCRQRKPWYITPNIEIPDLILTVFGDPPKLVVNEGKYAVSNSLLAGYIKSDITAEQLVCMWYNSLTLLSIELNVHSLGGGVFVLIPGEVDKLEIVNTIPQEEAVHVFKELDRCIKDNGLQAAYQLGDKLVLSKIYKLSDYQIQQIRDSVSTLQYWRLPNDRRSAKKR